MLSSHFPESLFAQSIACTSSLNIYLGPDDQSQMLFRNMLENGVGGCGGVLEILDGFWNVDIWQSNLARQIWILHF